MTEKMISLATGVFASIIALVSWKMGVPSPIPDLAAFVAFIAALSAL